MSSLVSYTFINIFTCWYKFPHMETKQKTHENVEMLMRMWKCAQLCNSHVKTYISWYGNKTEKTQNLVKCMSSHVNCRFPNVDLTSQNKTKQRTRKNMWKCAQMCNSHVKTYISRCRNKTEITRKHVKLMSSLVSCTFSHIFTCVLEFKHVKVNSKCDIFTWEKGHGWRPQESLWLQ